MVVDWNTKKLNVKENRNCLRHPNSLRGLRRLCCTGSANMSSSALRASSNSSTELSESISTGLKNGKISIISQKFNIYKLTHYDWNCFRIHCDSIANDERRSSLFRRALWSSTSFLAIRSKLDDEREFLWRLHSPFWCPKLFSTQESSSWALCSHWCSEFVVDTLVKDQRTR